MAAFLPLNKDDLVTDLRADLLERAHCRYCHRVHQVGRPADDLAWPTDHVRAEWTETCGPPNDEHFNRRGQRRVGNRATVVLQPRSGPR
jgi:hypothetical protein